MTDLSRFATIAGAVLGGLSVAGGAFGAHFLRESLAASGHAATWETGARYAMYHAVALLAVAQRATDFPTNARLRTAAWCFLAGTLIFSGCLQLLAVTGMTPLGGVVPIGGVLLIAGWLALATSAIWPGG
ncbi:MAG: DUF423 domain-containing protein [Planctomycetaceae bacterium]